jgi:primosomal protein N' (replication factor Y)
VMIQTFNGDHPVISALKGTISEEQLLSEDQELRKALHYPPYGRMARLRVESPDQGEARSRAQFLAQSVGALFSPSELEILGPSEAFLERAKGIFRWDLLIKSWEIRPLQKVIYTAKELSAQRKWTLLVDVDPYGGG